MTNITLKALVAALISTSATQAFASGSGDLDLNQGSPVAAVQGTPVLAPVADVLPADAAADVPAAVINLNSSLVPVPLPLLALSDAVDAGTQTESNSPAPVFAASPVVDEPNAPPSSPATLSSTPVADEGDYGLGNNDLVGQLEGIIEAEEAFIQQEEAVIGELQVEVSDLQAEVLALQAALAAAQLASSVAVADDAVADDAVLENASPASSSSSSEGGDDLGTIEEVGSGDEASPVAVDADSSPLVITEEN